MVKQRGNHRYSIGSPLEGGLLSFYFVEFDGGEVESRAMIGLSPGGSAYLRGKDMGGLDRLKEVGPS